MIVIALICGLSFAGCAKKNVTANVPSQPEPQAAAPTAELTATPSAVQAGERVELGWMTSNATKVELEGIGAVQPSGTHEVRPSVSTTYKLVAKGPGGEKEAVAEVTVAPAPAEPSTSKGDTGISNDAVRPIFFDYDRSSVRSDQLSVLLADADFLRDHADIRIILEGHADERGSTEYNLSLGDNRANAVRQGLIRAGVSSERIEIVSYGKERPFCTEPNEVCWQQNRRAHFLLTRD